MSSRNARIAKDCGNIGIPGNNRFSRKAQDSKNLLEVLKTVSPTGKLGFAEDCGNTQSAETMGPVGMLGLLDTVGILGLPRTLCPAGMLGLLKTMEIPEGLETVNPAGLLEICETVMCDYPQVCIYSYTSNLGQRSAGILRTFL